MNVSLSQSLTVSDSDSLFVLRTHEGRPCRHCLQDHRDPGLQALHCPRHLPGGWWKGGGQETSHITQARLRTNTDVSKQRTYSWPWFARSAICPRLSSWTLHEGRGGELLRQERREGAELQSARGTHRHSLRSRRSVSTSWSPQALGSLKARVAHLSLGTSGSLGGGW